MLEDMTSGISADDLISKQVTKRLISDNQMINLTSMDKMYGFLLLSAMRRNCQFPKYVSFFPVIVSDC